MTEPTLRLRPGDAAPPLAGPTWQGGWFDLADHLGAPVLLCFLRHAG